MKPRIVVFWLGLISIIGLTAFSVADDPFAALLKKLQDFTKKYPYEKVHLHLDKPYYAIGDDIWFKAYVTDSRTSEPTTISNILYVELINDKDSVQKLLKLPMQSGITWGDFQLPDSLTEGNYRIRAYTQWMRNAGPVFFFDKTIKIGNAWANKVFTKTDFVYSTENNKESVKAIIRFVNESSSPFINAEINYQILLGSQKTSGSKTITDAKGEININVLNKATNIIATIILPGGEKVIKRIPIKTTSSQVDVQFFPEGGNLIEELPCKVAIKVTNANGFGENVSGAILDNDGVEILNFETTYLGMGSFFLTPTVGKTYTAKVKLANNIEKIIALPKPEPSGYVLAVNNLDSTKATIKIMISPQLLNKGELDLIAQHNGKVLFTSKIPTAKQIASVVVPKINFPSGIVQFTLFKAQNMPVSERLIFVNNTGDKIDLDIQNLKSAYDKKSAIDLAITAKNNKNLVQGSFSVAVTNTKMVQPDTENESNILTSLLLTSDLTGYIEKPNHYFLNNNTKTLTELDNLLLTQGWRKINWLALNSSPFPTASFPAEKAMKISGVVLNDGKPVIKAKVSLMSSSATIFATDSETDAKGRFAFEPIAFKDGTNFTLKATTKSGHKGVKIVLDKLPATAVIANKNAADVEINVNENIKDYLKASVDYFNEQETKGFLKRTNQLKAVNIIGKVNKASSTSANRNGVGVADAVFGAEDLKNALSLKHFLDGRLTGVQLYAGMFYLTKNNPGVEDPLIPPALPMQIYLNGVRMDDPSGVDEIFISDIESIEVLKSVATTSAAYGTSDGVILITFKTGVERSIFNTRAPGMLAYSPKGFYPVRQFYAPKHDTNTDPKPDFRTTVYWNPHLVSDTNGKAIINFFNTDQIGNYRILIEGIDAFGNLARKIYTYEVK